jgi:hypothetical protein
MRARNYSLRSTLEKNPTILGGCVGNPYLGISSCLHVIRPRSPGSAYITISMRS